MNSWMILMIQSLVLGAGQCQEDPDGSFNKKYEPYSTLIAEQRHLKNYVSNHAWSTKEQNAMPSTKVIGVKVIVTNWDMTGAGNIDRNATIKEKISDLLDKEMTDLMSEIKFDGYHKMISIEAVGSRLRLGFVIAPKEGETLDILEAHLGKIIKTRNMTHLTITSGMLQRLSPIMKDTVIEVFLQLYGVKAEFGIDNPRSIKRKNMTDQMIHLIGTKFQNKFGEFYYRIVIMDFRPSRNSMIVRAAVLLDPDRDNLYHASNIWQSLLGFIRLGPFPLLPENIRMINSFMVLSEYSKYLDDRSYKRPLSQEFGDSPFMLITVPSFLVVGTVILVVIISLRCIHLCTMDQNGGWEPLE